MDGPRVTQRPLTLLLLLLISVVKMAAGLCFGRVETSAMTGPPHACLEAASRALAVAFVGEWSTDGRQTSCSVVHGCFTFSHRPHCPIYTLKPKGWILIFQAKSTSIEFPINVLENGLTSGMQFAEIPKQFKTPMPINTWPILFSEIAFGLSGSKGFIYVHFKMDVTDDIDSTFTSHFNNSAYRFYGKKNEQPFDNAISSFYMKYEPGKLLKFFQGGNEILKMEKNGGDMTFASAYFDNENLRDFYVRGRFRKDTHVIAETVC